jgi:hypothetical protein
VIVYDDDGIPEEVPDDYSDEALAAQERRADREFLKSGWFEPEHGRWANWREREPRIGSAAFADREWERERNGG